MVRELDLEPKGCRFKYQVRQGLSVGSVNNHRSLHPQYHDWGETLEQGTEPPTAPRAPQHWLPTAQGACCRAQIPSMGHQVTYFIMVSVLVNFYNAGWWSTWTMLENGTSCFGALLHIYHLWVHFSIQVTLQHTFHIYFVSYYFWVIFAFIRPNGKRGGQEVSIGRGTESGKDLETQLHHILKHSKVFDVF